MTTATTPLTTPAFADTLASVTPEQVAEWVRSADLATARRAMHADRPLDVRDLAALLSPAAAPLLEEMAQRAHQVGMQRHGRVVTFYVPLYLSNHCVNYCVYCGFKKGVKSIRRHTLSRDELIAEADRLRDMGFRHILLVSGEDRREVPVEYMADAAAICHARFESVALEVEALTHDEYAQIVAAGCEGLAIYQETYDRKVYKWAHPGKPESAPKADYDFRLAAPDRGAAAGMRHIGIGALLGLGDWHYEAVAMLLHARHIMKHHWMTKVSLSFPRLRDENGGFVPKSERTLSDREFVQLWCAVRLARPDAGLGLSTREAPALREARGPRGVNRRSAGRKTPPGGNAKP
ncbi:MAG: radical SAM protein, partial [Planctomycetota bacterium]